MDSIIRYIDKDKLVHAYGIEGRVDIVCKNIISILNNKCGVSVEGNPDFHIFSFKSFGINEARNLIEMAGRFPFAGNKKYFIVSFTQATREAQNALLKLLEEPTEGTHFFLLIPSHSILLPTLCSRLFLISERINKEISPRAKDFIQASPKKRLTLIKNIIDTKDKAEAVNFLNELEESIHDLVSLKESSLDERNILHCIIRARAYLNDRSPSVKMLLEQVSLLTPSHFKIF